MRIDKAVFETAAGFAVALISTRNAFDGFDGRSCSLRDRHETAVDDLAVENNGASATLSFAATFLSSGQVKLFAKNIEQALERMGLQSFRLTINGTGYFAGVSRSIHLRCGLPLT